MLSLFCIFLSVVRLHSPIFGGGSIPDTISIDPLVFVTPSDGGLTVVTLSPVIGDVFSGTGCPRRFDV